MSNITRFPFNGGMIVEEVENTVDPVRRKRGYRGDKNNVYW